MADTDNGISIYLKNSTAKNAVLPVGTSSHERYIILQNDTLQSENRCLRQKVSHMKKKQDDLETDSDRMEKSSVYMRGLLKNFVELDEMRSTVVDTERRMSKKMRTDFSEFSTAAKYNFYLASVMMGVYISVWSFILSLIEILPLIILVLFITYLQHKMLSRMVMPQFIYEKKNIIELTKKIKEIVDGQAILHEYIDSL